LLPSAFAPSRVSAATMPTPPVADLVLVRRKAMSRVAKIALIVVASLLAIPFFLVFLFVGSCQVRNWRVQHTIRSEFDLPLRSITEEKIQTALQRKFPIGTPRSDIIQFLTQRFGKDDLSIHPSSDPNLTELTYPLFYNDGFMYRDRIILS